MDNKNDAQTQGSSESSQKQPYEKPAMTEHEPLEDSTATFTTTYSRIVF